MIPLPFREKYPVLPDNHVEVYCRSKNTLSRLSKDKIKLEECLEVMANYIAMNHVEIVPQEELTPLRPGHAWWIPAFDVTHPKKKKVRIVFDSSAKYFGTCLDDNLIPGPDLGTRLKNVLIGFRNGCIGFSGDIQSMFHNFKIEECDKDYIRFYWYRDNDPKQGIAQYRANVHIFGNCSSPSVANLGLRYVANLPPRNDRVAKLVDTQFYVDDALGCSDEVVDAVDILQGTIDVLKRCNIRFHKICSSSPEVVNAFPESEGAKSNTVELDATTMQSALGMLWDTSSDHLIIRSSISDRPFTPRGILSVIHCIYDPLGISSPIVLDGKIIQRKILSDNHLDSSEFWDTELSSEQKDLWSAWTHSLRLLCGLSIPRGYRSNDFGKVETVQLHAYSDASTFGTGYVIYLKSTNTEGCIHVSFVLANSKIVPKSQPSIPRLELCSAMDLSTATREVADKLGITNENIYAYSDSMITLGYLRNKTKRFARYISRRVDLTLKNLPSDRWFYISTFDNPANLASRGQSFETLKDSVWLTGPKHLWEDKYPNDPPSTHSDLPESIPASTSLITNVGGNSFLTELCHKYSSLSKLVNVLTIVKTFVRQASIKAKQKLNVSHVPYAPPTFDQSLNTLIRDAQISCLPLLTETCSTKDHYLLSLSPFYDADGIIRVGGRLSRSDLAYENKFPILLPNDHPLSNIIISHYHEKVRHQGRSITLSAVRQAGFFICKASRTVRKYIGSCVTCRRLRGPLEKQRMADLPHDRLEVVPPFSNTGIDVFGPYDVADGTNTRRTTSTKKCWALVLVCLNSRAVHIEPLPYLDISSMKNALRRFFCLRGHSKIIRSDRGTNLIGTKNVDESLQSAIREESEHQNVEWILNPPKASHFGGIWERRIQSIKRILDHCLLLLGKRVLSRDDFHTYLQECASVLNSTPLWDISADPNDPRPLTPSMLLQLRDDSPVEKETYDEKDIMSYGSKRWRRVQFLSQQFWNRWKNDYLQNLQRRTKWVDTRRSLAVGDVVLLKDASKKRYEWPIARVVAVKLSADGLVRTVDLVTCSRSPGSIRRLTRPVSELCLLIAHHES